MSYIIGVDGGKKYFQSNYLPKYYEDIFLGLLELANDEEIISHNEKFEDYIKSKKDISSFYIMTLSILSDSIEDVYYDMDDVYFSDKINTALGDDLDDIGLKVGCLRPQATRAGVELTFTLSSPYDEVINIPENIVVSNVNGVSYYTTSKVNVPIGQTKFKVFALSLEAGSKYRVGKNSLQFINEEIILDDGETLSMSVINENSSSGGRDKFSDEEYRELLLDWVSNNIKGSGEAYERYFANADGIDSYRLIPNWNGITGTVKVVVDPGYSEQLNNIYDELNGLVTQFSEDIVLFSPNYVPVDIYAVCDVDIDVLNPYSKSEKESIKSRIEESIRKYIDGDLYSNDRKEYVGLALGEDFIPYKLGVYLSQKVPELKNIGFKYPLNPIKISDDELCKSNNIKIEMGSVSSFKEIDVDNDGNVDILGFDYNSDSYSNIN